MATLYLDYEGGNDNYGGTSFALLASGTDGRISSTTFSAATASFPNDGSLINQYLSIFNGSIYAVYQITAWVSSTSLTIAAISGGTALANQTVDRQYYIGGRWKTITGGATAVRIQPGDTVRLMGSPAPTSLGVNGTWTSGTLSGTTNISAATNATPIAITTSAVHGLSTGDTVVINNAGGNTAANGTWEVTVTSTTSFTLDGSSGNGAWTSGGFVRNRNNTRVKLASSLTQTIASTGPRGAWTAVAGGNVTTSLNTTDYKEHQYSDSIAITAGFTTGLAAYFPTGTLDLSGYQQVSFWIKQTAGTIGADASISLKLCSDTAGATAVNTIDIPNITILNQWTIFTVNLGTNLGSSIQSIGFYVNTDNAAQTFLLNNIIACKASSAADSLTLSSLISKNRSDDTWYGIQSISGTRVMLDQSTNTLPTSSTLMGYGHPSGTETITTYKRETIKTVIPSALGTVIQEVQDQGTSNNLISFEGGWDRTNMSSQSLQTWFDGQNGSGVGLYSVNKSFISLNNINAVRYNTCMQPISGTDIVITNGHFNNGTNYCLFTTIVLPTFTDVFCYGSNGNNIFTASNNCNYTRVFSAGASNQGMTFQNGGGFGGIVQNCKFFNNAGSGINTRDCFGLLVSSCVSNFNGGYGFRAGENANQKIKFDNCSATSNGIFGFYFETSPVTYLNDCTTTSNLTAGIGAGYSATIYANNTTINESTEFNTYVFASPRDPCLFSQKHDGIAGSNRIYCNGGLIITDTALRHTASGFSWKLSPTSSTIRTATFPLGLSLAKVAVAANALVTIKAWMYRDNSGLTMRLVCKGGQIAGVTNDVVSTVSATGSWEEETITFTPTEAGVVEITAEAYGGSTFNGWVDDMTISQA